MKSEGNIEQPQQIAPETSSLAALELKANLNEEQKSHLEKLKAKMNKILGNKTAKQLAAEGDLESLKKYNVILDEILEFLKTKKMEQTDDHEYQEKALDFLEKLDGLGADPEKILIGLAGLDSDRAWALRNKYASKKDALLLSLAGLDSVNSWATRSELIRQPITLGEHDSDIASSLVGVDSERAWKMRNNFIEQGIGISDFAVSLAGLNSASAWDIRNTHFANDFKRLIPASIISLDTAKAWELRRKALEMGATKELILSGLAGIDSKEAWKMREKLIDKSSSQSVHNQSVLQSLIGLDSDKAWEIRDRLYNENKITLAELAQYLGGLDSERAWEYRNKALQALEIESFWSPEDRKKMLGQIAKGVYGDWRAVAARLAQKERGER